MPVAGSSDVGTVLRAPRGPRTTSFAERAGDMHARLEREPLAGPRARRERREIGERLDAQHDDDLAAVGRRARWRRRSEPGRATSAR